MIGIVRKYSVPVLLTLSLLLNVAMIASLANSGGLRRIFLRRDLVGLSKTREEFQKEIEARYRKFPNTSAEIVFAGDSLIGDGPWAELFSDIHNRGIGGETTQGMLDRLDEILDSKPRKIFLLLGTNDLSKAVPIAQSIRNYRAILGRIRKDSPETTIHVIAMTPVNPTSQTKTSGNEEVIEFNGQLKRLVAEFPGVKFVDLTPILVDEQGKLRRDFTPDGCHLNNDAYLAIREPLAKLVFEDEPRKTSEAKTKP
jgi:lysophospholipase L1-like esterase